MNEVKKALRSMAVAEMPIGFKECECGQAEAIFVMAHDSEPYKIRLQLVGESRLRINSYLNENEGPNFAASAPLDLGGNRAVRSVIQSALIDIETMQRRTRREKDQDIGIAITKLYDHQIA